MMFKIYDGRSYFYQWDLNRKLIVGDSSIKEVHFCNRTDECSLVCEVYTEDGINLVNVPNILLQKYFNINAFAYDGESTKHWATFNVMPRSKPADYVYKETEVKSWEELKAGIAAAEEEIAAAEEEIAAAEIGLQNMLAPYFLNLENITFLFSTMRIVKNLVFTSNAGSAISTFTNTTGVKTAVINLPNAIAINNLFNGSSVEELTINADNITNAAGFAGNCKALRVLNFPNCKNIVSAAIALASLNSLELVTIPEQSLKVNLMLTASNNLTLESLTNIINGLADMTGAAAKTLTIGSVNIAKLTAELKEIAANKNWNIK